MNLCKIVSDWKKDEGSLELSCVQKDWYILIIKNLIMKTNSDSDFVPNSDDEHIKILDPKLQSKKRKAQLKMKDVSTKHSGLWNKQEN